MKFFGSTAVILLVIVVKDVLSDCPEGGCECGQFCVDNNNTWCNSNNDRECSCETGCLVFDQLMMPGDIETIYCSACFCPSLSSDGSAYCTNDEYCLPSNLTLNVDYPASKDNSQNCTDLYGSGDYEDYDYEETPKPQ